MINMPYQPIVKKYSEWAEAYSETTDRLIKRKKALLLTGALAEEWRALADDFLADDGRANHAFCMWMFAKLGGDNTPVPFDAEIIPVSPDCESGDTLLADHEELLPDEHSWTPA